MNVEFNGIERLLDELNERLTRLKTLKDNPRAVFDTDPFLKDIVERNLHIAIQCCLDICHRVNNMMDAPKPPDNYSAVIDMAELGILTPDFARNLAPIAGFRNLLVHEYVRLDWDQVYRHLQEIDTLEQFQHQVIEWLGKQRSL